MQLTQLKHFVTIANLGSMSKAAQELSISQPSLTVSIKQLEEELGQPVFTRSSKGVSLTSYGRNIYQSVVRILDDVEAIKPTPQPEKLITVCMMNVSNRITELVSEYSAAHPEIRFFVSAKHFGAPTSGRFDFYVSDRLPDERRQFNSINIPTEQLFAVVPAGSEYAELNGINPYELKDKPFVFSSFHDMNNLEPSYYVCIEAGFTPRVAVTTDNMHQKLMLISSGNFYGIITGSWYDAYKRMPTLKLVPVTGYTHSMKSFSLYWSDSAQDNKQTRDFLNYVRENLMKGYFTR